MTQETSRPGRARVPGWLRGLLVVSLAANLLVIGLAAGAMLRHGGGKSVHGPAPALGLALFRELPAADRRALRAWTGRHRNGHASDRGAEAAELGAALRAVPFDPAAVAAVLDTQAGHRAAFRKDLQAAWLDRVGLLSDTARGAYADRLQAALTAPRHRSGRDRGGDTGRQSPPPAD